MRWLAWFVAAACCSLVVAEEKPADELERATLAATEARKAAAADPTVSNAASPPVRAYLAEQQRRQAVRLAGLRRRLDDYQRDPSKQDLVPVLKQQLTELQGKPPEPVSFDAAYEYSPTTGLVGYSRKVRFLENSGDGKSIILVDNAALIVEGLGTSGYASGKFFGVDKAFLIGDPRPDYTFQGSPRKSYSATLVDLDAVLRPGVPAANKASAAEPAETITNRPKVAGVLQLHLRERREEPSGSGKIEVVERTVDWKVAETVIIVCDMWDDHHCKIAAQRVGVMAPRVNQVLSAARDRGMMIVHAPSETMEFYAGTPHRARMQAARPAQPPVPIERRCDVDPQREPSLLPVDRTLDCDDPTLGPVVRFHKRQHAAIDIIGFDGISDDGREIYNFCEQEGIKNVVLLGVHANYCVLARSYGIRQMVRLGRNVVLARDLTDALYDPRQPPYVSHARGTELVVEHIERYWCPSILSADLIQVVAGSDGPVAQPTAEKTSDKATVGPGAGTVAATASTGIAPTPRIFAAGGGILGGGPDFLLMRYILSLSGKPDPVVCCLPTARGDNLENLAVWYETMNTLPCRPRHLRLYGPTKDLRDFEQQLLSADIIFVPGGNTLNMLATWKAQGVDAMLHKAWQRGIVLAGESAGMVCWFEHAVTDSRPEQLTKMDCLGWLKGSGCAHYHYLPQPRLPRYHEMLKNGELKDGVACDDGAGLLFEGDKLAKVVTISTKATAYSVRHKDGQVIEQPLDAQLLVKAPQ